MGGGGGNFFPQLQIATLLQMKGSQTEFEQQERLFAMLEQKNGEIKHLLSEIRNLEKFKVRVTPFKTAAGGWGMKKNAAKF